MSTSANPQARNHDEWPILDFVRVLAAMLVLVGHTRFIYFGSPHDVIHMTTWRMAIYFMGDLCHQAVVLFFVISGFLVGGPAITLLNEHRFDISAYLINRFSRIYIVLIPALILAFALDRGSAALLPGINLHRDLLDGWADFNLACHLASLQGVACVSHADPPLWSLGYEWMLYLVGPVCIAIICAPLNWIARSIALVMLILTAVVVLPNYMQWQLLIAWFAGAAVYRWRAEASAPAVVGLAGLAILIAGFIIARDQGLPIFASDGIVAAGLVLVLSCGALTNSASLNSRFSNFVGPAKSSYSLYAIHLPVVVVCARLLQRLGVIDGNPALDLANGVAFVISLCVAVFAAYGFSRLTEANTGALRRTLRSAAGREQSSPAPSFARGQRAAQVRAAE
jgi:peptidoglycan/LPS O-acetylase OafA/YrhL